MADAQGGVCKLMDGHLALGKTKAVALWWDLQLEVMKAHGVVVVDFATVLHAHQ